MRSSVVLSLAALCALAQACGRRDGATGDAGAQAASAASLAPAAAPAAPTAPADPRFPARVVALAFETKVHERPSDKSKVLGYLRAGAVVPAGSGSAGNAGCAAGGWYPVAPTGYVCVAPDNASTDPNHEIARALARRPDTSERLPYMYGVVRKPGPIYSRLPTRAEAAQAEPELEPRIQEWLKGNNEDSASFRTDYWMRGKGRQATPPLTLWNEKTNEDVPPYLADGRIPPGDLSGLIKGGSALVVGQTKNHNGLALVDTAVYEGRRYGITTDLLVFPVDRMRPIEGSAYHGFKIPDDIDFPFAIIRREGASIMKYEHGHFTKVGDV